jgi:non-heme chloroperoxidase
MIYFTRFSLFFLFTLILFSSSCFGMNAQWTEGFVDNNGVKIHYIEKKADQSNKPSLLFIPGLSMPGWIFEKQLDYFSRNYTVVAMDPRSQGSSSQTTEGQYALARAGDIRAVVEKLEMSPVVLVGWSISVPEIVAYIDRYGSQGVSGIVMIDGLVGIDMKSEPFKNTMEWMYHFQTDREKNTKEFVMWMFKQPQSPEYIEKLTKASLITPTTTFVTLGYNTYSKDYRYALPGIDKPTLVVSCDGEHSDLLKEMSQSIPKAQFEVVDHAGHALFVDQPDRFNQLLEKFLAGLRKNS